VSGLRNAVTAYKTCDPVLGQRSTLTLLELSFAMSGANTPERDAQLLSVGHQCSLPSCHLVDFLPFKCQHCDQRFCVEHYSVDGHKCPKYDERKFDRVAPSCAYCCQFQNVTGN
jgi:hypothetical protein